MPARKTTAAAATTAAPRRRATPRRPRATQPTVTTPTHAAISERAYFIHLAEGDGDPLGHWLRAERELTPA